MALASSHVVLTLTQGVEWALDGLLGNGYALPDAGWFGTANDFTTFMLTLGHGKGLAPNGYRLLSPDTVDLLLHKNHLPGGKFIDVCLRV